MRSPEFQPGFACALLDPDLPTPAGLTAWNGAVERRFNVYRNNVAVSLIEALEQSFPVCVQLVGEAFFRVLARAFLRAHPPSSPVMSEFGQALPAFIAGFEPANDVPYLADVAAIEAGRIRAYHAADADPVGIGELAALAPEALMETRFRLHPSLAILRSEHPACSIWQAHQGDDPTAPEDWTAEDVLITRPQMRVEVHRLLPGEADFLAALADGLSLGAAAAAPTDSEFNLSHTLARIFGFGLIAALLTPEQEFRDVDGAF